MLIEQIQPRSASAANAIRNKLPFAALGALLGRVAAGLRHSWQHRCDAQLLRDGSDHILNDLGITRDEIESRIGRDRYR